MFAQMIPPMSIESAYAACEQLCRQASSTFFASFAALPSEKRSAVHAVYAFCRRADDIADGDHLPESNPDAGLDAMVEARDEDLRSVHGVPPANPPEVHLRRLRDHHACQLHEPMPLGIASLDVMNDIGLYRAHLS